MLDSLKITENDLDQFTNFLAGKKFSYRTDSESILEELTKTAMEEGLYDSNREAMEKLKIRPQPYLEREMTLYRPDVTELIESELAGRYFYDWGMWNIQSNRDTQIKKAIDIAGNRAHYASLLKAPAGI